MSSDAATPKPDYAFLAGFDGDWRDIWWNTDYLELMAKRLRFEAVKRVLDVGCGVGHWGRTLARVLPEGVELVGVDRDPAFVEQASAKAAELGLSPRFSYRVGEAEALPVEDASF